MCVGEKGEREGGGRETRGRDGKQTTIFVYLNTHTYTHEFKILPLFLTVHELNMNKSFIAVAGHERERKNKQK